MTQLHITPSAATVTITVTNPNGVMQLYSDPARTVTLAQPVTVSSATDVYTNVTRGIETTVTATFPSGATAVLLSEPIVPLSTININVPSDPGVTGPTAQGNQPLLAGGSAYGSGTAYTPGTIVTSGGQTFINRVACTGVAPVASTTTTNWLYFPGGSSTGAMPLHPGIKTYFFGDSITNGSGASNATYAFPAQAARTAGTALVQATTINGNPGQTSDYLVSILATAVADAVSHGCEHMHLEVGTNDTDPTKIQTNIPLIVAAFNAAGLTASVNTVPPRGPGGGSSLQGRVDKQNLWLRRWAKRAGVPLADVHAVLVDPTTGYYLTAMNSGDDVHPSEAGHLAMGIVVGQAIAGTQLASPWYVNAVSAVGLLSNPLMASSGTGWTDQGGTASAGTRGTVAATQSDELPAGQWLTWNINNLAGGSSVYREIAATLDNTQYSAGDVCAVMGYASHDDPVGSALKVQITNNSTGFTSVLDTSRSINNPGPFLGTFTIPGSPGTLRVSMVLTASAGTNVTAYLGACQVFNLTADSDTTIF
jgi:lysophospholipase L1-like esterase